jgi:hypothetical protein
VELHDLWTEALRDRRRERDLERAGGDHDLVGLACPVVELDQVGGVGLADRANAAVELDRQVEVTGVVGQVGDDLVPTGVVPGITRESHAGERVIAGRREQLERVPPLAPRGGRLLGGFEDREIAALPSKEVADCKSGLAGPGL